MKICIYALLLFASHAAHGTGIFAPVSGASGQAGHQDGKGGGARFNDPMGLVRDVLGNLYICDARNHVIRKISAAGIVTTLAGLPGEAGALDGIAGAARFRFPADLAIAPDGTLFVADSGNHCIRKIAVNGAVSTIAGDLGKADDISQDYGDSYTMVPRQLDGNGAAAHFNSPSGIAYSPAGFLYVSDSANHIIRKVALDGTVTTLAGSAGVWGSADGAGAIARFYSPMGLCISPAGDLYIADSLNHTIRRMSPQGVVTTYAGNALEAGCRIGPRLDARFCEPADVAPHPGGGFIVCESFGNALFRIGVDGTVSLYAGNLSQPEVPAANSLSRPTSAVCDEGGNVYVADTFNQEVRLIIEKFDSLTTRVGNSSQLTITWDSLPGRDYQLQILGVSGWENAPRIPIRATAEKTAITFPIPPEKSGIYRVLLLGF